MHTDVFLRILAYGFLLFFIAFIIQLCWWRLWLPERQTKTLLCIYFGTFISWFAIRVIFTEWRSPLGMIFQQTFFEYLHVAFLFFSLTCAYIITYSAIEADSPSLIMVLKIKDAGAAGLDEIKFKEFVNDEYLVVPRINDLVLDKMIDYDGQKYRLTPKGRCMARIFVYQRKILNSNMGG